MDLKTDKKNRILALMADSSYVPMKEKELVIVMQVDKADRELFKQCLNELLEEGNISVSKRGKYSLPLEENLMGVFNSSGHGYGFVNIEGVDGDYYIAEKNINGAMHLDEVLIEPLDIYNNRSGRNNDRRFISSKKSGRSKEAVVVKVLKRATDIIVGTYDAAKNQYGFVIPDNNKIEQDIFVPIASSMGAQNGHKVVCKIVNYGDERHSPEGKIIEILGHVSDPGVDILAILKAYGVDIEFPTKVINQAAKVQTELVDTDYNGREDLRNLTMVTIDGEDSKDLDDAVSLTKNGDNYELGVHIADVTHYVKEGSAIDREALERGTSCYPTDRVVPMLPHVLCNGICSLNENVDRLALSCFMDINEKGEIVDHRFLTSVIRTNHRMTYGDVNKIITENDTELTEKYSDVADMLLEMNKLAYLLRARRKSRGSIDFELAETSILLDDKGHPVSVKPHERNDATKLIEDFMLAANETVAEHFYWAELPFVYRVHEKPETDKIKKLSYFIKNFGFSIKMKDDSVHPKELQKLLTSIEGTPEETLISRLTLRSMQRAKYSVECDGHFGLALKYYCHFTSPIRRYPDLQIHRIIKEYLVGTLTESRIGHYNKILTDVCANSSKRERVANDVEREVDKLKKAEYMADHIGEIYDGVISGVTNWGIYVELPNTVEGLVHISKIAGDYFTYNEDKYELVGNGTGKKYSLGNPIKVCVNSVDLQLRAVDFVIAE